MSSNPVRILTVDLEDWFHLLEYDGSSDVSRWNSYPERIHRNTDLLLETFAEAGVQATFFSLGWVARTYPHLLRRIVAAGHEVGSHSDTHDLVHQRSPAQFREDLHRSMTAISDATRQPVHLFRAPGFSITRRCLWAFEVLAESGIRVDASLFPSAHAHGGFGALNQGPTRIETRSGALRELPVTTREVAGRGFAFAGGGYFRLLPSSLVRRWSAREPYLMTYFHPRDFDPEQPILPDLSRKRRFKSYVGLRGARRKLVKLLSIGGFGSVSQAEARIAWDRVPWLTL